jgi:iron-sulfur cluster assembly accessory protein
MLASLQATAAAPAAVRPADERLLKVKPAAAARIRALLIKRGLASGVLRVAVVGGGCSGLQYQMDLQAAPAAGDFLVESDGARVAVDARSALYMTGAELDYVEALQGAGFKIKNPNAASTCSCGESFSA